ncbi:MAG: serpin family protein [Bacteroidales bacterium]|nr:serpin family protein [Bacteroidales bacterium]
MKRIAMLTVMAAMTACGEPVQKPAEGSQTGFALSFFKNAVSAVSSEENVVVSPYSAGVVLSMLEAGAQGETKVEFDNALNGAYFNAEDFGSGDGITIESSNSVWISDDFSVRNRYVDLMEKDFDAFVTTQNFADPSTVQAINNWCSEHTSGKIDQIIDRIGPDMVMILVNALYFNAPWADAFDENATRDAVFHGRSGDTEVKMMSRKAMYNYAEYQGAKMIEIPYAGGKYAMYVVLPPAGMTPESILPYIGEHLYDSAMSMLQPKEVALSMPEFKAETSLVLNKTLQKMGISTAFSPAADFKGISVMGPLRLDLVKQKCYIDVTEKGTEAAAVTSAQIRMTSARPAQSMNIDRPFIFVIADMEEKGILFAGKIVNL